MEAAWLLWRQVEPPLDQATPGRTGFLRLENMAGTHPVLVQGIYRLHYLDFTRKLRRFFSLTVPLFARFQEWKQQHVLKRETELGPLRARALTSFVRNQP